MRGLQENGAQSAEPCNQVGIGGLGVVDTDMRSGRS